MTSVQKHCWAVLLLLSCAAAQSTGGTATVQTVTAARDGANVRVEITLSAPEDVAALAARLRGSERLLLLLDYDGTLVPFARAPVGGRPLNVVQTF